MATKQLREYIFTNAEFKKGKYIGAGAFGYAFELWDQRQSPPVRYAGKAPKTQVKPGDDEATIRHRMFRIAQDIIHEMEMLMNVKHMATLNLLGFLQDMDITPKEDRRSGPVIIMPYMPKGDLQDAIEKEFKEESIANWNATKKSINIFGIAAGMAAIHNAGICHGDLKEANVFLNDQLEPVVADFGLSDFASPSELLVDQKGTPIYMAPEIIAKKGFELPADVYAYGVLLYRLFERRLYFGMTAITDAKTLFSGIRSGQRYRRSAAIPDYLWDLISRCWDQEPSKRPTFMQIVNELYENRNQWKLPGTNMAELEEYMERAKQGLYIDFDDLDALLATI